MEPFVPLILVIIFLWLMTGNPIKADEPKDSNDPLPEDFE